MAASPLLVELPRSAINGSHPLPRTTGATKALRPSPPCGGQHRCSPRSLQIDQPNKLPELKQRQTRLDYDSIDGYHTQDWYLSTRWLGTTGRGSGSQTKSYDEIKGYHVFECVVIYTQAVQLQP
jgi:hypothetical protein